MASASASKLRDDAQAPARLDRARGARHRPLSRTEIVELLRPKQRAIIRTGGRVVTVGAAIRGDTIRASSSAVRATQVIVVASAEEATSRVFAVWLVVGLLAAGGLGVAVALALVQGRRLVRPLEDLTSAAKRLGTGVSQSGSSGRPAACLARGQSEQARQVDVTAIVREHSRGWRRLFASRRSVLRVEVEPDLHACVSAAAVGQALDVLLENALEHGEGQALIQAQARDDAVLVEVSDAGAGVPAGLEERVFERHVSLHGGTGLGLAVARALIEREGGRLRLASARPAVFELWLPCTASDGDGEPSA